MEEQFSSRAVSGVYPQSVMLYQIRHIFIRTHSTTKCVWLLVVTLMSIVLVFK